MIVPLFLEVDIAVCLEDELVKLLDVRVLSRHAVVVREGEGGLVVPVDDVHGSQGGGLDREDGGGYQTLSWHCRDGEEILMRASGVTNLLRDTLADPYGDSLVLEPGLFVQLKSQNVSELSVLPANLLRDLPALGDWLTLANLIRNVMTFLLRHVPTNRIGNLLGVSLLNIMTFVVWILLTTAWDWCPDLLFPHNLPVILAVFLVGGHTLSLSVRLQHGLILVHTDFFVCGVALLSSGVLTQPLALHLTQLLVDSLANLEWLVLVLGIPDGDVLHGAVDGLHSLHQLLRSGGSRGRGGGLNLIRGC